MAVQACAAPASAGFKDAARRAGATLTAGALWALVALDAGAVDLSAGEEVFTNNCAACHTGGANVVQAEKTLQKDALVQYLDGGFKVESIVTQVRTSQVRLKQNRCILLGCLSRASCKLPAPKDGMYTRGIGVLCISLASFGTLALCG